MSFNSNVQPKRIVKEKPDTWYCHSCNMEVAYYYRKCPECHELRSR